MDKTKDYGPKDLEASLKRAFKDRRADCIIADGQTLRNEFLRESIELGVEKGWLYQADDINEDDILGAGRGQYTAYTYRLTDKGKKYFGI